MARLTLKNIRKSFGRMETIHGIDLDIADQRFVVFVGPSGCGKSTLLRLIAGLEDITSGDLLIDDIRVNDQTPKERGISMVFQSYALYPHMNVYQNMAFGLKLAKDSAQSIEQKVKEAARILELTPLLERLPKQLSGGQRQRVAIGRAIVRNPKVFLFDEPLSNLDAALRVQMRIEIARLHKQMKATMIYVTHDQVEAMTMADEIVVLNAGNIEQVGSPLELYHHPKNLFVAGFIGSPQMNFLKTQVASHDATGVKLALPGDDFIVVPINGASLRQGDELTLGLRPEHFVKDAPQGISGRVDVIEELGESYFLYLRTADGKLLTIRQSGAAPFTVGDQLRIGVEAHACHLFCSDGAALPKQNA